MNQKSDDQDDLLDDDQFETDTAYDDAGVEDIGDDWDGTGAEAPAKPKKSMTSTIIIVFGALAALAVVYFTVLAPGDQGGDDLAPAQMTAPQNGQEDPNAPPAPAQSDLAGLKDAAPVGDQSAAPPAPADATAPPQGFMTDPGQLAPAQPETPPAPAPAPDAAQNAGPLTPMPDFPTAHDLQKSGTETPAAPPPADVAATAPPASPVAPEAVPEAPAEAAPTATPTAPAPETAPPVPASADLAAALERINKLEAELQAVKSEKSSAPSGDPGELATLRIAVERLESRVEKLSAVPAPAPPARAETTVDDGITAVTDTPAPKPVKVKKPAAAKPAAPVKSWELRSAWNGTAMIGRPGESDLRSIAVGETVPGLGRITSIAKMGGVWVVQGTSGRLTQ